MRGSWTSGKSHRRNQMLMEDSELLINLKRGEMKKGWILCIRVVLCPRLPTPVCQQQPRGWKLFLKQQKPLDQIPQIPLKPYYKATGLLFGICLEFSFYLFYIFVFQSGTLKDPDSSKTPPQRPAPQGCLQYILDCNGIAVGPKQVQAS